MGLNCWGKGILWSKLLTPEGGYIGDYIREHDRSYSGEY